MDIRIKVIEKLISLCGLTRKDFMSYWQRELTEKEQSKQEDCKELPKYWYQMQTPDIRRNVKLFDYAFEGGKFSPNPKAYPNCQGVVGYINPYADASEGNKIFVVLPEQGYCTFSDAPCEVGTQFCKSGKEATLILIQYGQKYGLKFPAAEYANNYCKNGIKKGEAFLPSSQELNAVCKNAEGIREAIKKIGGYFDGSLWSATEETDYGLFPLILECDNENACCVNHNYKCSKGKKTHKKLVSCFIAY